MRGAARSTAASSCSSASSLTSLNAMGMSCSSANRWTSWSSAVSSRPIATAVSGNRWIRCASIAFSIGCGTAARPLGRSGDGTAMKVLITGNMGYVGPAVVSHLRNGHPEWTIDGFDTGYFGHCLTGVDDLPERKVDRQFFGDVRNLPANVVEGYDGIVQLAAISNDPMGNRFAEVTHDINCNSAIAIAQAGSAAGVGRM